MSANVLLVGFGRVQELFLTESLAEYAIACERVESGEEALAVFREKRFEVVLTRLMLPGIDGVQTARLIRQSQKAVRTNSTIIGFSSDKQKWKDCCDAGMDAWLSFPRNHTELLNTLARLSPILIIDWENWKVRFPCEELKLLSMALDELPQMTQEVREAVSSNSPGQVARSCHTLHKGVLELLAGGTLPAKASHTLEMMGRRGNLAGAEQVLQDLDRGIETIEIALRAILKQKKRANSVTENCLAIDKDGAVMVARFVAPDFGSHEFVEQLGNDLHRLVEDEGASIVLDFTGIEDCDSHFRGKLIDLASYTQSRGGRLAVCNLSATARELFHKLKFDRVLTITQDVEAAIAALQQQRVEFRN